MLELQSITKSFGQDLAVDDFNLTVRKGQLTVLIGPSGCGKSTLLKLIMGLIFPDTGMVRINDVLLTHATILKLRHKIGYVIQEGGLFPHLTARKNVILLAKHLNWSREAISARIHTLLELTQLSNEILERYPTQISGGQRQRVSLMRALMLNPDVLLLDEPLGSLDPMIRRDMQLELRSIVRELNKTVLLVTHDMGEADFFGDEIVLMKNGKIIQQGDLNTLIDQPTDSFVTSFISAQRNSLFPSARGDT